MTYSFKNAIIRQPNKSIQNGLSSQHLHPQFEIIAEEHSNYIKAIEKAGLQITLLEPKEDYPDSIFVYYVLYITYFILCIYSVWQQNIFWGKLLLAKQGHSKMSKHQKHHNLYKFFKYLRSGKESQRHAGHFGLKIIGSGQF